MGSSGGDTSTQTNTPPEYLTNFMNYMQQNVQPLIGSGQLNPRVPDGWQYSANLDPSVSGANDSIMSYLNGTQYQGAQNQMFQNLNNLSNGNTPSNPLSQSGGANQNLMQQTLSQLMQGMIPGGQITQGQNGPEFTVNPPSGGNIGFQGGGVNWSSGPSGTYNPLTNADIQAQVDASNDDAVRAMERGGLRDIRMGAIDSGGLGGSRQGIAEGVLQGEVQRGMARNAAEIRAQADNNERNRLAQIAMANTSAGASLGASGNAANTQLQLGQMANNMDLMRLLSGNALGAANANQGLMNSGQGFGIDALRNALALAPGTMQSPIGNLLQSAGLGMQITDFNQSGLDRNLAGYLQSNSTYLNDLNSYAGMLFGSNPGSYATQTTQGPSSSRFGNAMGGAMSGYAASGGQGWGSSLGFFAGLFG